MSRVAPVSSEEIERLSNGFAKIGPTDGRMINEAGSGSAVKKGFDDLDELREDEIWGVMEGPIVEQKHSRKEGFQPAVSYQSKEGGSGGISRPISKMRSLLSMELKASSRSNATTGIGFAAVESLENSHGGGGFSTRKVNISGRVDGDQDNRGEVVGAYVVPQSVPVSVPMWMKRSQSCELMDFERRTVVKKSTTSRAYGGENGEEDEDNGVENCDEKWMPPHEIVARSQTMTSSVCEGAGRTLKGMDLRRVRNAVWSKIGFMD